MRHVDRRDHRRIVREAIQAVQGGRPDGLCPGAHHEHAKGANWLWSWNLAIPAGSKKVDAAQKFITWSTSRDYIQLVAETNGWANVPTGTRKSTYASPEFQKAARFAAAEKTAIDSANPNDSTLPKSPYVGVQFAAIPEFQAIGIAVGQQMSRCSGRQDDGGCGPQGQPGDRRARDEEGRLLQIGIHSATAREGETGPVFLAVREYGSGNAPA